MLDFAYLSDIPVKITAANIFERGFRTGSTVFGVDTKDSDIDIVVHPDIAEDVLALPGVVINSEEYDEDQTRVCCRVPSTKYNLIVCLTELEYLRWVTATNCIKLLCGNNDFKKLIKDKETRVSLFKTLRDNYGDIA